MIDSRYGNHLFGKIAANLKKKSLWFDIQYSNINFTLLGIIANAGIISSFIIWNNNNKKQIRVFLKYSNLELPLMLPINFYFKSGNKTAVRLKNLKEMQDSLGNTVLVLSTPKGILTHNDCIKYKTGGYLYFIIYG